MATHLNAIAMFMEYCPAGDLEVFIPDPQMGKIWEGERMFEVDLWGMFACLAAAVGVMARGTEDDEADPIFHGTGDEELVHNE